MGWIKGAAVCFCIPFFTLYWSNGAFAVPSGSRLSSADCSNPFAPFYTKPIRTNPNPEDCSVSKRQQLLNQASILLKKLSPPELYYPLDCASEDPESVLIQSLIDRLEALDNTNTQVANPSKNPVVISEVTYNAIVKRYNNLCILINNSLARTDAANVLSALSDLFANFNKIITASLPSIELPKMCSKILVLNNQLAAACAPEELQAAIADFIKLLTVALTGQNQVTITTICDCLSDLESSIVTVVQNDESERQQTLLNNLLNAVLNAVVSGNNNNDIIKIVRNYVTSIKEATKQDAKSRAKNIYSSILNFEKELSKVLIKPADLAADQVSSDVLNSPSQSDKSKNPNNLGLQFAPVYDASDIVDDGSFFIINEDIVQLKDDNQNVIESLRSGIYKIVNPESNVSWSGNFAVQQGSINSDPDGSITIVSTTLYDVDLPQIDFSPSLLPRVKRQGIFKLQDNIIVTTDKQENSKRIESGTYSVMDSTTGRAKTGKFVVTNTISRQNSDDSINVIKAGFLTVDNAQTTSLIISGNGDGYLLEHEYIFETPDKNGNLGMTQYNLNYPSTSKSEIGMYTVRKKSVIKNDDGSVNKMTSGLLQYDDSKKASFVLNAHLDSVTDKYGHVTTVASGLFVRTDLKTGQKSVRNSVVPNIMTIDNPDGSKSTIAFGKVTTNGRSASNVDPTSQKGSLDIKGLGKPVLLSKNSFQALLNDLQPVTLNQTPKSQVKPTDGQTDPKKTTPLLLCANSGSTPVDGVQKVNMIAKYNASSIVSENTVFIISSFITPLLDSDGNVFNRIELGTYWFRDEKTSLSWNGAFEVTNAEKKSNSPKKLHTMKAGTFEVAPPSIALCTPSILPVEGIFSLDNYVVSRENGAGGMSENGMYFVVDTTTDDARYGDFIVMNKVNKVLDNGVIQVMKTGFLGVNNSGSIPPKERISRNGFGRYFLFEDRNSLDPKTDGNKGTGSYSIKDSATNKGMVGTYVIRDRTITTNSDGTTDITTIGVIYIASSDFDGTSSSSASVVNVEDGAHFVSTDHLVTITDVYGHESTFGTGKFSQVNPKTGMIESATYEVKNLATTTGDDGSTNTIKFGWIPNDAYTTGSKSPTTSTPIAVLNDVIFKFEDHLFDLPNSGGKYGTGSYKISNVVTGEVVEGTYDVQKQSISIQPDGTVVRKSTGVIRADPSKSSRIISDSRLTVLDGANVEFNEQLSYKKDSKNNVIVTGTGLLTQTVPSTGLTLSTKYEINDFNIKVANVDGSQDVTKSGTIDYEPTVKVSNNSPPSSGGSSGSDPASMSSNSNPAQKPPQSASTPIVVVNDVIFKFEDHLFDLPNSGGKYGTGSYKISNVVTGELVEGTYDVQKQSISIQPDGTVVRKSTGVIRADPSKSSRIISDSRLTVLDGANVEFNEQLSYKKDSKNNVIVTGTGLLTQTVPSTGLTLSTKYEINDFKVKADNFDGSQDVTKSGTMSYEPTVKVGEKPSQAPPGQDDKVSIAFTKSLSDAPDSNGNYGLGQYEIKKLATNERVTGTYIIQERTAIGNPDGTVIWKMSGVIRIAKDKSSPLNSLSDTRLTILDGKPFMMEINMSNSMDTKENTITSSNGLLTQTDPASGIIVKTYYTIEAFKPGCDSSKYLSTSGSIKYTEITNPSMSSGFTPVTQTPIKPVSVAPSIPTNTKSNVQFKFEDYLSAIPNSDGNYGTGKYKIDNILTKESVEGTYDIQRRKLVAKSDVTVIWEISGVIYVNTLQSSPTISDLRLTVFDGANYIMKEIRTYKKDVNGNVIVHGTGLFTQIVSSTCFNSTISYTIGTISDICASDGSQNIIRSGRMGTSTIGVINSANDPLVGSSGTGQLSNLANKPLKVSSGVDDDVTFEFNSLLSDVVNKDGNYGSGTYKIEKPSIGQQTVGTYSVSEQSIVSNPNGSRTLKLSGVIRVQTDKSTPPNSLKDTRLVVLDTAQYTLEETVSFDTDVDGNTIATGTGILTQTDLKAAEIHFTYFTINAFNTNPVNSGVKTVVTSGTIDSSKSLAYLSSSKPNPTSLTSPKTVSQTNYVKLPLEDVISVVKGGDVQLGDLVIIQTDDGHALLGQIQDSKSPVTFYVAKLADIVQAYDDKQRVVIVPEKNFSIKNRLLIEAALQGLPC